MLRFTQSLGQFLPVDSQFDVAITTATASQALQASVISTAQALLSLNLPLSQLSLNNIQATISKNTGPLVSQSPNI